jgi:hypothetical protein
MHRCQLASAPTTCRRRRRSAASTAVRRRRPPVAATEPPKPPPPSPSSRLSGAPTPAPTFVAWPPESPPANPARSAQPETVLSQGELPRAAPCGDCGRKLRRGAEALHDEALTEVLCLECVTLDTVHSLGTPGAGARREHARRLDRHQTRVRTAHPRLGGLILALADDPQHVRAWQTGAVGEEEFGRRLSGCSGPQLKVLHDRKLPRSSANIDHLAVTPRPSGSSTPSATRARSRPAGEACCPPVHRSSTSVAATRPSWSRA